MTRYHTETTEAFARKIAYLLHSRDQSADFHVNGSGTPVLSARDADGTLYHITISRARDQRERR